MLRRWLLWAFFGMRLATLSGGLLLPRAAPGEHSWIASLACIAVLLLMDAAVCRMRAYAYAVELCTEGLAIRYAALRKVHETLLYGKVR